MSTTPASARQPKIRWDARFERSFRRRRFCGFVALGDAVADRHGSLREHDQDLVSAGVYAIFAPIDWAPTWKTRGPLANVINPWSRALLRARWVNDAELVYIGCAGATASSRTLHNRIGDLLKHGAGQISASGHHNGGERIWQCVGWDSFTLAWKPTGPYPNRTTSKSQSVSASNASQDSCPSPTFASDHPATSSTTGAVEPAAAGASATFDNATLQTCHALQLGRPAGTALSCRPSVAEGVVHHAPAPEAKRSCRCLLADFGAELAVSRRAHVAAGTVPATA